MKKNSLIILCAAGLLIANGAVLAISAPILTSPADGAVFNVTANSMAEVTFAWENTPDAAWYKYIIFLTGNGEDFMRQDNYTQTSKVIKFSLYQADNYTFGIRACRRNWYYSADCGNMSYRTFIIQAGAPGSGPGGMSNPKPILTAPANGTVAPTLTPTLTWSWSGDATQLNTFEINLTGDLENNQTEKTLTSVQGQNYYNISGLLKDNKTYTWKVRTLTRVYANGPWSDSWTFTTQPSAAPLLQSPFLLSPVTGNPTTPITTLTPTLTWGNRAGASCYQAEVINNVWSGKTAGASIDVPAGKLQDKQTYHWRARASSKDCASAAADYDWGNWSGLETFSVDLNYVAPPATGGGTARLRVPRNNALCPAKGLVPCGTPGCPCQFCDFFVMFNRVVRFAMLTLAPIIAVLMLVIGGVMFLSAGAKPDMLNQAKGIITSVVMGLVIIFTAWIVVNTVLTKSGIVSNQNILQWYNIGCSSQ